MVERARSGLPERVVMLLALAGGCGGDMVSDPTLVTSSGWGAAQAAVLCAKIFSCCKAGESPGFAFPSEAACRQSIASDQQMKVGPFLALGVTVYDGHAAFRCFEEAAAMSCADFFRYGRPVLSGPSCSKVFTGVRKIGEPCGDLDAYCESSDCESGFCVVRPCSDVRCLDGQYCDPATSGCLPVKAIGTSCSASGECDPSLGCHGGLCGPPRAMGAVCATSLDCAEGSCQPAGGPPGRGICGPPLADGAACSVPSECTSGGCSFVGQTGGPVCGPMVCAGGA
jgi:hypothetical protein